MKIASIVPYKILPPVQGGERHIYFFTQALSRYAKVACFTVEENINWKTEKITIKPVLGSTKNKFRYVNWGLVSKIKNECRREGISHLILEHPYFGWLGYLLKKRAGLKLVIHSHNIESLRFKALKKSWWRILYQYEGFAHRMADISFFITEEDRDFAIRQYGLAPEKCFVSTYGIESAQAPGPEKKTARQAVCEELGLTPETKLLLFNGALNYAPNQHAVEKIIGAINPLLRQRIKGPYKIIICGKAEGPLLRQLQQPSNPEIAYLGFVPDIWQYFLAADLFINPVTEGGGIKTKLVEALAANTPAVSFKTGAYGVPPSVTGQQLATVADGNYDAFATAIISQLSVEQGDIPRAFFEHFNWDTIARRALTVLEQN